MPLRPTPIVFILAGLIVAAHVLAATASSGVRDFLVWTFAVIPARFQEGFDPIVLAAAPLLGHVFLHGDLAFSTMSALHLGMNMLVLMQVAGPVSQRFASRGPAPARFLILFFGSAACGALGYILINPDGTIPAVGASGAVCGVFAATLLASARDWRAALASPQIRSAAFWFLFINVGLAAGVTLLGVLPFGIAWEAHLGGFLGGALIYPALAPRVQTRPWAGGPDDHSVI